MTIAIARKAAAFLTLSAALMFVATQAEAHAALKSANPAPNAAGAAPATIQLHFSEALEMKVSSFKLTNIDGAEVKIMPAAASDKLSLAATPAAPLSPGLYTVSWTAVGDDAHPMKGTYSFTVK